MSPPGLGLSNGRIARADLDGTNVDQDFVSFGRDIADVDIPWFLAVDALTEQGRRQGERREDPEATGKRIIVKVRVKAKERLTARASGKVKVNPTYKLRPKKVQVAAGKTKTLRLKPKKAKAKKIARALKRGEKAKAKLSVKLTDLAENSETERFTVRLKR